MLVYANVTTSPLQTRAVAALQGLDAAGVTLRVGRQILRRGGKQVHDVNIVATMRAHGLRRLPTHNVVDFGRFGGIIDVGTL